MNDELAKLLDLARPGQPDPFHRLVQMLREVSRDDVTVLVDFARADDELKRRAAIAAAAGRTEPALVEAITALAQDPSAFVRQALAYALTDHPTWPLDRVAETLLGDADQNVRQAAVWAAKPRPALTPLLAQRLGVEDSAWVRNDIANALADCAPRIVLPALLTRLADDVDPGVQQSCAYSLEKHLGVLRTYPADLSRPPLKTLSAIRRKVGTFTYGSFANLLNWLDQQLAAHVDVEQLAALGTVLTLEAEQGTLPRAHCADQAVDSVLALLEGAPPRAVVLVGESGSGKTAIVQEITHRLLNDFVQPGYVLRMAPQDFLAGTKFIGEWETKVRSVITAIKPPRRVILYIPNIEELAWMGTWEKSEASVASALAPYIERGDLTILGETTVEAFRKGLGANRSLRRLFHAVEVQPCDAKETRIILQKVAEEADAVVPDAVLDRLGELAEYFVAGTVQPGRSVGLLRKVLSLTSGRQGPITEQDVLQTISTSTGIPVGILDDAVAFDRASVKAFFEARVMGQPEAVEAVVDLVTLVKAGLTDPHKPFGVFLFVGPTGVGKTEMARALAEHLFGDAARLVRLDMSEFATYEAFERLIGGSYRGAEPGLLTASVRERPFSVLLFDEIEKAHPNIYNLCLQVFDAGRLTDAQGRTADFRRTIIIMTSNIGSSAATEAPVGFGRKAAAAPDRDAMLRELGRWFRPEFLNRLDRIVNFRPLTVETAEKIAQREVVRVLERSGIARRSLAVDVDPAVLPILLREGYSPTYGARPLKRTIERLVLLPVARLIAEGKAPAGSLLRLVAGHNRVEVEVEPPESAEAPTPPALRALPVNQRAQELLARVQKIKQDSTPLAARKSEILAQATAPGYWEDAANRRAFDEVYRLDGVLESLETLEKKIRGEADLAQRQRHSDRDLARIDEHLDGLESQARHVAFLVGCRDPHALGDVILTLRLTGRHGKGLAGVLTLARMYLNLAERRGLEIQILDDRVSPPADAKRSPHAPRGGTPETARANEPHEDTITLVLSGAGAYALLAGESGLHQFSQGRKGEGKGAPERETIRVEVLPFPAGDVQFAPDELQIEVRPPAVERGRLLSKLNHDVRLFHAATMTSVRGWCDGSKAEAIERYKVLLRARLDAQKNPEKPYVVRRYRLGPTTLVRDQRTGRSSGRLDQIIDGHLDMFLLPPDYKKS